MLLEPNLANFADLFLRCGITMLKDTSHGAGLVFFLRSAALLHAGARLRGGGVLAVDGRDELVIDVAPWAFGCPCCVPAMAGLFLMSQIRLFPRGVLLPSKNSVLPA